ncbi:MAG: GNAT family N-acetyltransferase [Hyphomonadaceae bacterium]|nr:GNAT family N-acetyltransferase [Hyphomonadaceae bacterium]
MSGLTLRAASAADIPALQAIERDAAERFRPLGLLTLGEGGSSVVSADDHARAIAAGLSRIAVREGEAVGFAMGALHTREVYLHEISVLRAHQGCGVGSALLDDFAAAARAAGANAIILSTFRAVSWNAPYYARRGFVELPATEHAPWMRATERDQAAYVDVALRVFMRREL